MNIFDFLMNKIGFVIVISGFLLTMLSRQRAKNGDPKSNPKMPSFGGSPNGSDPGQWIPGRKSRDANTEARSEPKRVDQDVYLREELHPPANSGWERSDQLVSSSTEARERGGLVSATRAGAIGAGGIKDDPLYDSESATDKEMFGEDVRRGVIWAEILGPPRAKQPYTYRKLK